MIDYLKPLRTYVGYMDETGLATIEKHGSQDNGNGMDTSMAGGLWD